MSRPKSGAMEIGKILMEVLILTLLTSGAVWASTVCFFDGAINLLMIFVILLFFIFYAYTMTKPMNLKESIDKILYWIKISAGCYFSYSLGKFPDDLSTVFKGVACFVALVVIIIFLTYKNIKSDGTME